jgi:hypothetical protein
LLQDCSDKRLKLDIVFFNPMRTIIIAGFVLALASGLFLNYPGHQWQVLAQTNSTTNATQGSTGASGNTTSQSQGASQGSNSSSGGVSGGGNKSTTPDSTVATMKSGPKAAGSASQLQQIEGPNATNIMSSNTPVGNKPGMQGLASEGNTTSQSNATNSSSSSGSAAQNATSGAGSAAQNATSGAGSAAQNATSGAGSAAQNATSGAGSAAGNASSAAKGQNNTNPLAKIPVIGKLFGG